MHPADRAAAPSRREFLRVAGVTTVAVAGLSAPLAAAERLIADPYAPLPRTLPRQASRATPIRLRGRVHAGGRGLRGVAVSDGLAVAVTGADGRFDFVSDGRRGWLSVSLPAGHRIPVSKTGTALLHRPIPPAPAREATFDLPLEPVDGDDERHAFLLLADTQTQNAFEMGRLHAETVPDVQATVRRLGGVPVFGIACGDIMYDDLALYPEYERAVASAGAPFFQVVGNHDLNLDRRSDDAARETFERHFGPRHYSFNVGAIHYVVLDDVFWFGTDYVGYVADDQLAWLRADLAQLERGRPVVVAAHIPFASTRPVRSGHPEDAAGEMVNNRELLYEILKPYRAHLLSGHTHESEHVFQHGVHEHVNGTVCGAWWSGDICWDGTPNGYGVYEVAGEELRWQYQSTGQPADHQLRVYPRGADPAAPEELVANVWNWDPEWQVVWYENGERRGAMARRRGLDPLAVKEQTGPERPARRSWVEPTPTEHLFYARPTDQASTIVVEATDRWGRRYTAGS